jgi:hypothetical protein
VALLWQLVSAVSASLPCFAMGWRLARVWKDPLAVEEGRWINLGVGIMVLEFVIVHSGVAFAGLIGSAEGTGRRLLGAGGLAVLYFIFAGTIALAFRSRLLLGTYLLIMGGRAIAVIVGASQGEARFIVAQSVTAIVLYFGAVILSLFPLPRLGMTEEKVAPFRDPAASGHWIDKPHCAIGAGAVYFFLLGAADLFVLSWIDLPAPRSW